MINLSDNMTILQKVKRENEEGGNKRGLRKRVIKTARRMERQN